MRGANKDDPARTRRAPDRIGGLQRFPAGSIPGLRPGRTLLEAPGASRTTRAVLWWCLAVGLLLTAGIWAQLWLLAD